MSKSRAQHWPSAVVHMVGPMHIIFIEVIPIITTNITNIIRDIIDNVVPRNPSAAAPTRGIRPVTSPGRCNGVTAPTTAAVGPPSPARFAPVLASRAKPPERRREESDNYSEIFQNIQF